MKLFLMLAASAVASLTHTIAGLKVDGREYVVSPVELGRKGEWVLYPKGAPRTAEHRRWLTKQLAVEMEPGRELPAVVGALKRQKVAGITVLEMQGGPEAALEAERRLRLLPGVKRIQPVLARQLQKRFIPNDPLFSYQSILPSYQWNLRNTGELGGLAGVDINVTNAWDQWKGNGVAIAIVDDGIDLTHPDLAFNVDTALDIDFNGADADPTPGVGDDHGTACAGIAAAVGNNSLGGSGVAPNAKLVGMRLIAGPSTDVDEANAFLHEKQQIAIKSNSWGPSDSAYGDGGPSLLGLAALQNAAETGRGGLGTVFLWSGGNGNQSGDDSNYDGWTASIYAIAVAALTNEGKQPFYGEPGANLLISAPSNGGSQGITTTDRTSTLGYNSGGSSGDYASGDYTNSFGGTSAACPTVAGVVALMLEANPNLGYRDVQEILVRTARQNDLYDTGWLLNGAGQLFNVKYGAGLVDATAATALAVGWTNLAPLQQRTFPITSLPTTIPDGNAAGLTKTFTISAIDSLRVEHVTVALEATHEYRGELEWWLTSPSGMTSRLARSRLNDTTTELDWTFMSTHFRGERSEGEWKLRVVDRSIGNTGSLTSATIQVYGTPITEPLPLPVITSSTGIACREGAVLSFQVTASNFPSLFAATGLPPGLSIDSATGLITGEPSGGDGLYFGNLSATNATGTTTISLICQVLGADPALATAVEQPLSAKLVPFGDADWFSQTITSFDGVDAAQSGSIGHDEFCGMEMTVEGPTKIQFRWKVSSEAGYDYLIFVVDGVIANFISGEQNWAQVSYDVGPGTHTIDFDYFKDETVVAGADAGWIDQLVLTPITDPPVVNGATVSGYQSVSFQYQVTGTNAPTSYAASGLPAGLSIDPATGRISGSPTALGTFSATISATNDFGTGSGNLVIQIESLELGLAAALEAPEFTFTTSGNKPWAPQRIYAADGEDAARSGAIPDLSESIFATEVEGPASGSFYWGISSEANYDYLRFYIDEVEQLPGISGEVGWTQRSFTLPSGMHALKWVYRKDDFVRSGLDAGFVDRLVIVQDVDGDGFNRKQETYFGTSDTDAGQQPVATMSSSGSGITIHFPSVLGNSYRVECSQDLVSWTTLTTVSATGTLTSYTDTTAVSNQRCYYRVIVP
jgi:subtilisin-like proprotein convertase family protein